MLTRLWSVNLRVGDLMATWLKEGITLENGNIVQAQMPVIISASRSTDIPAFYADWFVAIYV